jgi:prepilin-type N-terminal cleavage/methylation domain-containing protein
MRLRAGFSLIESVVAVALLAIIVVSILSGFSSVTLAATRHQQLTTLDRLTRSDVEYIKSQAYSASNTPPYRHITAAGYAFSYQILYWKKNLGFATTNPDTGLQEIILTVNGPNSTTEQLDFLKELP